MPNITCRKAVTNIAACFGVRDDGREPFIMEGDYSGVGVGDYPGVGVGDYPY